MPDKATLRGQLKTVLAGISETREERVTLRKARDEAKEAFSGIDLSDPKAVESDDFKAAEKAVADLGHAEDRLADLQLSEKTILGLLGQDVPDPAAAEQNGGVSIGGDRVSSLVEGELYERLKAGASSKTAIGTVTLGEAADRESAMAMVAGGVRAESSGEENQVVGIENKQGATTADRRGFITPSLRQLTLLDLIPTGTTDATTVEYVQVVTLPTGATEVHEGAYKPRLGMTTQDASAPVRTIAGYVKIKKQALEDAAGLASIIRLLLPYEVRRRLESQILVGTGEGDQIKGLLNTSGIGAPAKVKGDNPADAILRAITTVVLSDGDPNFVALHPTIWQNLLLMRWSEKAIEGGREVSGGYLYGEPSSVVAPTIWGLAITKNRVVPQATPLVGDANAAAILVRSGLQVLLSDSDGDDFIRNRVTVLAEMRVALPVWRPSAFAKAAVE